MSLFVRDRLVCDDIHIDVRAIQPFLKTIPIYYDPEGFMDVQYLVRRPDTIQLLCEGANEGGTGETPTATHVPDEFEKMPVALELVEYETAKLLGWECFARSHSLEVTPEDFRKVQEIGYPFHQWGGFFPLLDYECSEAECVNKRCPNYGGRLREAGAILNEVTKGVKICPLSDDDDRDFQLVVAICEGCPTVRTSARVSPY